MVYLAAAVVMERESGRRGRVEGVFGVRTGTCQRADGGKQRAGDGGRQRARSREGQSAGGGGEEDGDGDGEEEEEEERDVGMVFSLLAGVPEMWDGEDEDADVDVDENEEGGDAEGEDAVETLEDPR